MVKTRAKKLLVRYLNNCCFHCLHHYMVLNHYLFSSRATEKCLTRYPISHLKIFINFTNRIIIYELSWNIIQFITRVRRSGTKKFLMRSCQSVSPGQSLSSVYSSPSIKRTIIQLNARKKKFSQSYLVGLSQFVKFLKINY